LALLSFALSVATVGVATIGARALGWLPSEWSWLHAIILGANLGGSSSIIVIPAMTLAKVKSSVASLVNLESAFTDAFCVVGAAVMIDFIVSGGGSGAGGASPAAMLGRSLGLGVAIGLGFGFLWLLFLRLLQVSDHAYPITLSALLLLYVAIDQVGGSAALGILTCAVVVGNANLIGTKLGFGTKLDLSADVRGFNRQVTFIVKSFFFTFMGAMLGPPWGLVALGALFGVLLLVVRVPAVSVALLGSGLLPGERQMVLVSMPRGMAAGVLATLPVAAGIPGTTDLPNVVFAGALVSILIFAVGFPRARGRADREAAAAPPAERAAAPATGDGTPAGPDGPPPDAASPTPPTTAVEPAAAPDDDAPPTDAPEPDPT
jgi:cell volume regulation protein A